MRLLALFGPLTGRKVSFPFPFLSYEVMEEAQTVSPMMNYRKGKMIRTILPLSPQVPQARNMLGFFSHTNPYILNVTQQCRCSPMLIFRTWAACALSCV